MGCIVHSSFIEFESLRSHGRKIEKEKRKIKDAPALSLLSLPSLPSLLSLLSLKALSKPKCKV